MAAAEKQTHKVGKRKTSIARIYLRPRAGEVGKITVNRRAFEIYFPREILQKKALQPMEITETLGQYDILINVQGGGTSAQAGAVRHGLARVLEKLDASYRPALKKAGFLTRDSRDVRSTAWPEHVSASSSPSVNRFLFEFIKRPGFPVLGDQAFLFCAAFSLERLSFGS
jgi:small subunit ribosomal protein S9